MPEKTPAVRILPMSTDEFEDPTNQQPLSHQDVQAQFFLTDLPSREGGRYYYVSKGLDAERGTVVLFQYDKKIIASAVFEGRESFADPVGHYHGALKFDVDSIRVFDPVGPELLHSVWPDEFKRFGNVMKGLTGDSFPDFERQLTGVRTPTYGGWDRRFQESVQKALQRSPSERKTRLANASPVPKRVTVTTTVFERNPDVVAEVLDRADGVCEECNSPAPFIRRSDGTPYLEVHHKKRLADGGEDTVKNAIALCPNCHREAHYA